MVGVDNARAIFDAARHPESFVALDSAGHLLGDAADAGFAATMIATWAGRYLPAPGPAEEGRVVVTETGGLQQRITIGPSPYDLLLAGDCANCETKVGRIERSIHLDGDLDEDQRARLLEIADKCPVHRTMHTEIDIATALEP